MSSGFKLVNPNAKRTLRMWRIVRRMNDAEMGKASAR